MTGSRIQGRLDGSFGGAPLLHLTIGRAGHLSVWHAMALPENRTITKTF